MYVNLYGMMRDPKVFPEPDKLKPERFIDDDGQLRRVEQWAPFSMGRQPMFTQGQFWSSGIVVGCVSLYVSPFVWGGVCPSVYQSQVRLRNNVWSV